MDYFKNHWQGKHSLSRSLYVNLILLRGLFLVLDPGWLFQFVTYDRYSSLLILAYSFFAHGILLVWQMVGLHRSCDRYLRAGGNSGTSWWIYGVMLVCAILTLVKIPDTIIPPVGEITRNQLSKNLKQQQLEKYRLDVIPEQNLVRLDGSIELGVTELLINILQQYPRTSFLQLNSDGGNIFAARGLAQLIEKQGLKTQVTQTCNSACTLVYIAGARRTIGPEGRLGFHQYRLLAGYPDTFTNPDSEQDKDRLFFFRKGVTQDFLDRIYSSAADSIWYPDQQMLLGAGVVHAVVSEPIK